MTSNRLPAISTPWGMSQSARQIAPGIIRYDTASHGGYFVDDDRLAEMPAPLRSFGPWAGKNWYEEDCDWAIVALAFPDFFPAVCLSAAVDSLKRYQPEILAKLAAMKPEAGTSLERVVTLARNAA